MMLRFVFATSRVVTLAACIFAAYGKVRESLTVKEMFLCLVFNLIYPRPSIPTPIP